MNWVRRLRKTWHDLYYAKATPRRIDFAMRCKAVVHQVDVKNKNFSLKNRFRFQLHLSLCQTCENYSNFSKILKNQLKLILRPPPPKDQLQRINQKLLQQYARKNQSKNP